MARRAVSVRRALDDAAGRSIEVADPAVARDGLGDAIGLAF
jgi:hypothetical protein